MSTDAKPTVTRSTPTDRALGIDETVRSDEPISPPYEPEVSFDEVLEETGMTTSKAFHNFRGDRLEVYKLTTTALSPDALSIGDHIGKSIKVVNFYCHAVTLYNETTGRMEVAARTVLIDEKGKAYASVSDGIRDSLKIMTDNLGRDLGDGIKIKFTETKTNKKRTMYLFEPV